MFIIGNAFNFLLLSLLCFILLIGGRSDDIIASIDNSILLIAKSQYETGLVEMHTELESGEFGMPVVHRLYSDFSTLHQLDEHAFLMDIYDSCTQGLDYDTCYMRQIGYNGEVYNVFAYIFPDADTSMQYYENFTDDPALNRNPWYKWTTKPQPCFIAYDGENALRIEGRSVEMIALLLEAFPYVFNIEMTSAQEIMDKALYSGELGEAMEQYILDRNEIIAEPTE